MERFSREWADQIPDWINAYEPYKQYGKKWVWPILFKELDELGTPLAQIGVHLVNGSCTGSVYNPEEESEFPVVLQAKSRDWQDILDGHLDPMVAIARKRLRLEKGSMLTLMKFNKAAIALVKAFVEGEKTYHPPESDKDTKEEDLSKGTPFQEAPKNDQPKTFQTLSRGINRSSFSMKLFEKAKVLGIWNPSDLDFSKDIQDWKRLSELEKEVMIHLTSLFQGGEESVTNDIMPLIQAMSAQGKLEEELFLTAFLFEEAKHTDFFNRCLTEIFQAPIETLESFEGESYETLFKQMLPNAMNAIRSDHSPKALLRASITYNLIVEGVLAETGYVAYQNMLESNQIMPGIQKGIGLLKQDESRHIAFGMFLIVGILKEQPTLVSYFYEEVQNLLPIAMGVIEHIFDSYPEMPFGLELEAFLDIGMKHFDRRVSRIEKALDPSNTTFNPELFT